MKARSKQEVVTTEAYEDHPLHQLDQSIDYLLPLYAKARAESKRCHQKIWQRIKKLDTMYVEKKISREERDQKTDALYIKSGYREASNELNALAGALVLAAEKVLQMEPPNAEALATHAKAVAALSNIYAQDVFNEIPPLLNNVLRLAGKKALPEGIV